MVPKSGLKVKLRYLYLAIGAAILFSCQNSPDFSNTPKIAFEDVLFKEAGPGLIQDSLIVIVSFEDGDGDLGLDNRFIDFPYQPNNYFGDQNNNLITIKYLDSAGFESLPPYEFPYTCTNWIDSPDDVPGIGVVEDTVFFESNPNHFNMDIAFFVKDNSSDEFEEFDWRTDVPNTCGVPSNVRFPVLQEPNQNLPLEGTIRFAFANAGLLLLFENSIMKLEIRIRDRNLNVSNTVESGEFNLRDIQVN